LKTITEAEFEEDLLTFMDFAHTEPVEVVRDSEESVVIMSKTRYEAMVLELAPAIR